MIISYYAVFRYENDGIDISFPDIPNAFTCAYSADEGVSMAKEVLELILHKKKITDLPVPSAAESIKNINNESVELISVSMSEKNGVLYGNNIVEFD